MDDIIRIILEYLRREYGSQDAVLIFGYRANIEPVIRFTLPNYPIIAELSAKNLIKVQKYHGTKRTLKLLDEKIEEMLFEYRRRFPDEF